MEDMQRGDLVFWSGHVAIMLDEAMMLHANAHSMKVSIESFHAAVGRIAAHDGGDILAIKRPDVLSAGDLKE
jgi:cell wall-associated NlpC family hydrolase